MSKSRKRDTPRPDAVLETLNQIRLERDLTYEQLADAIGMDASTVFRLLNQPDRKAHDRSLFKVRRYVERQTLKREASA